MWKCPNCKTFNTDAYKVCSWCGKPKGCICPKWYESKHEPGCSYSIEPLKDLKTINVKGKE